MEEFVVLVVMFLLCLITTADKTCPMCQVRWGGELGGDCTKLGPCDVTGRYSVMAKWTCQPTPIMTTEDEIDDDDDMRVPDYQPRDHQKGKAPFSYFDIEPHKDELHDLQLQNEINRFAKFGSSKVGAGEMLYDITAPNRTQKEKAPRRFDYDLVLYPNRRRRIHAACWLGGGEGFGCKAFRSAAACDIRNTALCLMWKSVGDLGDVVLRFKWDTPDVESCHFAADTTAAGFWLKQFSSWLEFEEPLMHGDGDEGRIVKAIVTVGSNYSLATTENIIKTKCPKLSADIMEAFQVKGPSDLKLVNLRLIGYNQKGYTGGHIFASAINLDQPYDTTPLRHVKDPGNFERNIDKASLGVNHEQIILNAQECYRDTGVKLISVERDGVSQSKTPPVQHIWRHYNADILWTHVAVQLYKSRYALRDHDVCGNMPMAYTKELTCNAELMPQVRNVFVMPKDAGHSWMDLLDPEGVVEVLTEPLNVMLGLGCLVVWICVASHYINVRDMMPTYLESQANKDRYTLPPKVVNNALGHVLSIETSDRAELTTSGSFQLPMVQTNWLKKLGVGWVTEEKWWAKRRENKLGMQPVNLGPTQEYPIGQADIEQRSWHAERGGGDRSWVPPDLTRRETGVGWLDGSLFTNRNRPF